MLGSLSKVKGFLLVIVNVHLQATSATHRKGQQISMDHKALLRVFTSCIPRINLLCRLQYVENGERHQNLSTHEAQRCQVEEQEPLPEGSLEKGKIAGHSHQQQLVVSASRKHEQGVASWISFLECEARGSAGSV